MKKKKKIKKLFVTLLILLVLAVGGYFALVYFGIFDKDEIIKKIKKEEPKLQILDLESNTRPFAVMIDNVKGARPQHGLEKAYLMYEIIVEGGLTRMMAVFKDVDVEQIGPVRSARHYFIDYAMENDAIYVHHGKSPQADGALKYYKIADLDGLYNPSSMFWRGKDKEAPHNSYTSSAGILKAAEAKEYRTTSDDWQLLDYSVSSVDLSKKEDAKKADKVVVNFSSGVYSTFDYDTTIKKYHKGVNGSEHMDANGTQYSFKNIIVVEGIKNYSIGDTTNLSRQEIDNLGTGTGWFVSEGYARPITWEKSNEESKTTYKYSDGKEIKVNDGTTFIVLAPKGKPAEITGIEETSSTTSN